MARALAWWWILLLVACDPQPGPTSCFDVCGEGTRCEQERCVVAAEPESEPEVPAVPTKAGKRGRKRSNAAAEDGGDGEPATDTARYVPVADGHIPRYDAKATTVLDPDAGSERLGDSVVRAELRRLEPALDRCIVDAVAGGIDVGGGRVDFVFGLTAKGKVSGVTAKAAGPLRESGVLGCLRKVVFDHRFPAYDGPPMGVDYSFEIG